MNFIEDDPHEGFGALIWLAVCLLAFAIGAMVFAFL